MTMSKSVISSVKLAKPTAPFSMGTKAGNVVFFAGLVATNDKGEIVGKGDVRAQTRQILENMKLVAETAGASLRDVTKTTVYLTDFSNYAGMNEVYGQYFPNDPPARATVGVALINKDFLIEIDAYAVLG
jgi:reactive intermediate/imine deaminase